MPMPSIFKAGHTINENCKCRTAVTGIINARGIAQFSCPCGHKWQYVMRGKGKGSKFSSADLSRIIQTRNITIA